MTCYENYSIEIIENSGLLKENKLPYSCPKAICEMSERVITKLAVKYESIRKEVTSIMGGKVLEYEAKDILRKGIKEGIEVGKLETLC